MGLPSHNRWSCPTASRRTVSRSIPSDNHHEHFFQQPEVGEQRQFLDPSEAGGNGLLLADLAVWSRRQEALQWEVASPPRVPRRAGTTSAFPGSGSQPPDRKREFRTCSRSPTA